MRTFPVAPVSVFCALLSAVCALFFPRQVLAQRGPCIQYARHQGKKVCVAYDDFVPQAQTVKVRVSFRSSDGKSLFPEVRWRLKEDKILCDADAQSCEATVTPYGKTIPLIARLNGYRDNTFEVTQESGGSWNSKEEVLYRCPRVSFPNLPQVSTARANAAGDSETRVLVNNTFVGFWPSNFLEGSLEEAIARKLELPRVQGCWLPAGRYSFELQRSGFRALQRWVDLKVDEEALVDGDFQAVGGSILVRSAVGNVNVLLDGKVVARLPEAQESDLSIELAGIVVGKHTVELRFPFEDSSTHGPQVLWGQFSHIQSGVAVYDGRLTTVDFAVDAPTWSDNPAEWTAKRALLSELCEQDPSACLAAGWAQRFGVGGDVDLPRAAQSFKCACQSSWSSVTFEDRDALKERRLRGKAQACLAYNWLLSTGLVREQSLSIIDSCGNDLWSENEPEQFDICSVGVIPPDPLSPCVRNSLSRMSQRQNDPTVYIDHTVNNRRAGLPLYMRAEAGFEANHGELRKRELRVGYGVFLEYDWLSIDLLLDGGVLQFARDNVNFTRREWLNGWGLAYEFGPSFHLLPHASLSTHFRFGILNLPSADALAFMYAGRVALVCSANQMSRSRLSVELGVTYEAYAGSMLKPDDGALVERFRANGDVLELRESIEQSRNVREVLVNPNIQLVLTL